METKTRETLSASVAGKGVEDFTFVPKGQIPSVRGIIFWAVFAVTTVTFFAVIQGPEFMVNNQIEAKRLIGMEKEAADRAEQFWKNVFNGNFNNTTSYLSSGLTTAIGAFGDQICQNSEGICGLERGNQALAKAVNNTLGESAAVYQCHVETNWVIKDPFNGSFRRGTRHQLNKKGPHTMTGECVFGASPTAMLSNEVKAEITMQVVEEAWVLTQFSIRAGREILRVTNGGISMERMPVQWGSRR